MAQEVAEQKSFIYGSYGYYSSMLILQNNGDLKLVAKLNNFSTMI